jgi:hypothetical protein
VPAAIIANLKPPGDLSNRLGFNNPAATGHLRMWLGWHPPEIDPNNEVKLEENLTERRDQTQTPRTTAVAQPNPPPPPAEVTVTTEDRGDSTADSGTCCNQNCNVQRSRLDYFCSEHCAQEYTVTRQDSQSRERQFVTSVHTKSIQGAKVLRIGWMKLDDDKIRRATQQANSTIEYKAYCKGCLLALTPMKFCSGSKQDLHRGAIPDEVRRLFDTKQKLQLFRQQ